MMVAWNRLAQRAAGVVAVASVLPALAGLSTAAEKPWLEVKTPHFVVVANTSEGTARDVGWQFEQVRYVFEALWTWAHHESGRPFLVFALRSEADLKALAPKFWENGGDGAAAVAVSGPDKDYVALRAGLAASDDAQTNPYFFAYWGYATSLLDGSFPGRLPPWYQRGMADLFGNTLVRGKDVQVGRLIPHHLERLAQGPRYPLTDVLAADWKSKYLVDDDARRIFDAQAWMLVHYLAFGEQGAHRGQLNRFAALLHEGKPADAALREALGDPRVVANGFNNYLGQRLYSYATIKADLNVKAEGFQVQPLAKADTAALHAGFHAAMGRSREAQALLEEARRSDPQSVLASEVEAVMLDREGKQAEALAAYARAADAGSANYYVHYRRASLLRRPDAPKDVVAQMAKSFEQAVQLNPDHAWSQASLARALSQVEPGERAVGAAKKAMALEPGVAAHRLALVQALWEASQRDEARREAQSLLAAAADDADRKAAQEWIDFMSHAEVAGQRAEAPTAPAAGVTASASGSTNDWVPMATQACESGTATACAAVASAHQSGIGAPKDPARALALFEKACGLSELRACAYAAYLKFHGNGVPKDVAGATNLATKACDAGALEGCTTLGVIHASRSTAQDLARARELLTKACAGGEANACQFLKSLPK